ncbi:nutrient reservoir, partial [Rhizoctonia solani]
MDKLLSSSMVIRKESQYYPMLHHFSISSYSGAKTTLVLIVRFAVLKLQLIGTSIESDHGFTPSLAGPAASSIPAEAVTVDDNDLTRVSYSVGWDPAVQTSQYHAFHYGNTMHRTSQTGAYASFKFNGTAAWYYTDLSPGHGKVNVTLDGERSWLVNGDATFISAQRVLWNVSDLPYGEHTVVITHQDTAGLWATLDFFRYLPTEPASPSLKTSLPIGPIVGGVVGGVVIFALCGVGYMFARRRYTPARPPYFEPKNSDGPPLLNSGPRSTHQIHSQPAWGYISEPYRPSTPVISPANLGPRASKQPIQGTNDLVRACGSSNMASGSWRAMSSTSEGSEVNKNNMDNPPPYVQS